MNFKYRYGLLLLLSVAVLASLILFNPYRARRSSGEKFGIRYHRSTRRRLSLVTTTNSSQRSFLDFSAYTLQVGKDLRLFSALSPKAAQGGSRILRTNIVSSSDAKNTKPALHSCRMQNCFDHSICQKNGFRVYVYPTDPLDPEVSGKYKEILNSIRRSRYYTEDPDKACLFVLALDTLDRDPLSSEYVTGLGARLERLSLWKGGANHLVFNLYSGTWPDYNENDVGFNLGLAMLAKSSISQQHFRPGFDISFPLFHKEHSFKGGEGGYLQVTGTLASHRRYALVFKGKRYLTGIGSKTRNSLYHVDNGGDIILLTTCKHGKDWKNLEDERCEQDNKEYDKWDYKVLLKNSTFCLVPRGRRLGSYRFLEALQAGCIPVILSNDWVLPFSEVIDWRKSLIWADERLLLQLPTIIRSIDIKTILSLRQQTQFLWDTYFSSIDKIVTTTLEIIKGRLIIGGLDAQTSLVWNSSPGCLVFLNEHSQSLNRYPFYWMYFPESYWSQNEGDDPVQKSLSSSSSSSSSSTSGEPSGKLHQKINEPLHSLDELEPQKNVKYKFDAVVKVTLRSLPVHSQLSPLHKILKTLAKCTSLGKVHILWHLDEPTSPTFKWTHFTVPIIHKLIQKENYTEYLFDDDSEDDEDRSVVTDAILNLDENSFLNSDEIEFGFHVWLNFQHRLVGYIGRSHFWHDAKQTWRYTSKATSDFSLVLVTPAFYHRYYNRLYATLVPPFLQKLASSCDLCHSIIMNSVISHVTKLPPIKLGHRRRTTPYEDQTRPVSPLVRPITNVDTLELGFYSQKATNNEDHSEFEMLKTIDYNDILNQKDTIGQEQNHKGLLYKVLHQQINQQNIFNDSNQQHLQDTPHEENQLHINSFSFFSDATSQQNKTVFGKFHRESNASHQLACAHYCLLAISDYLGYMPLVKSSVRFDPLLFKDPVSIVRKKYPGVDKVT